MALEKATIVNLETGRPVKVLFNPEEYSIKRDNNFAQSAIPGLSSPVTQFVAGNMRTLELELFIDTYVDQSAGADASVVADELISMMNILPETHAPPRIEFAWGGYVDITMSRAPDFNRLAPNVYYLQGFSGHGIALTGIAGQLVAETIAGQAERFDVFTKLRHRKFPGGAALRMPALVLAMAWYRLRDFL